MKKSKAVKLILITAALAGCQQNKQADDWANGNKTYVRGDSTAPYSRTHPGHAVGSALLWYYAFRPVGFYHNGRYNRSGYYSGAIPHTANVGRNALKTNISRGGFGRTGVRASS